MPRHGVKRGGRDLLFLRCHGEDQSGMVSERGKEDVVFVCCSGWRMNLRDQICQSSVSADDDDESLAAAWGRMEPTAGNVLRVAAVK